MPRCTFCKREYEWPRGTTVVTHEGEGIVRHFCSKKCRKNFEMGRDNKRVNWVRKSDIAETEAYVPASMKKESVAVVEKAPEKKEEHKKEAKKA